MERIPVSPGYRRELTWRFRVGVVLLVGFLAARLYLRDLLGIDLDWIPFAAIFVPSSRGGPADAVALIESYNYAYAFVFILWLRYGFVLSVDYVWLRFREGRRRRSRGSLRSPRAKTTA